MSAEAPNTLLSYRLSHRPEILAGTTQPDTDRLSITIGEDLPTSVKASQVTLAVPLGTGPGDLVKDPDTINVETTGGSLPSQGGGWDVLRLTNDAGTHEILHWTPRRGSATFDGTWTLTLTLDFQPNPAARSVTIGIQEETSTSSTTHSRKQIMMTLDSESTVVTPSGSGLFS
ncbi:hypothetical protein ACQKM2_01975 [Streptomyces sp. NPDC004126]|uniref:hypothetical protein n=1 Tax=Streptomyces sp. NPDC004126 TaxID=3390695 RepID=UPI003D013417